jgi:hypothetical protein
MSHVLNQFQTLNFNVPVSVISQISREELIQMAPELEITVEEANKLFDDLDVNKSGYIERKEDPKAFITTIPGRIGLLCKQFITSLYHTHVQYSQHTLTNVLHFRFSSILARTVYGYRPKVPSSEQSSFWRQQPRPRADVDRQLVLCDSDSNHGGLRRHHPSHERRAHLSRGLDDSDVRVGVYGARRFHFPIHQ